MNDGNLDEAYLSLPDVVMNFDIYYKTNISYSKYVIVIHTFRYLLFQVVIVFCKLLQHFLLLLMGARYRGKIRMGKKNVLQTLGFSL
jgi:hypothetical protein